MFKTIVFVTLCVAVLAHKEPRPPGPQGPPGQPPSDQGKSEVEDIPHSRVARQMPSMSGGMNPLQFPSMMADVAQKGMGVASTMMDPNAWMKGMSQMGGPMSKSKK